MQSNRWAWTHRHAVPMFVASVAAAILSGAAFITVVVLGPNGDASPHAEGGTGESSPHPPTGEPTGGLGDGPATGQPGWVGEDGECLVGSWRVVSLTQGSETALVSLLDGRVVLAGEGPVFEFRPDGTGRADYGDPTIFEAQTLGDTMEMEVRGQIDFGYQAGDGVFRLVDSTSNAEATMPLVGKFPFELDSEPVSFTCDGQVAEFHEDGRQYAARYERIS